MRRRRSVLPMLEYLERLSEIKAIHRDVSTRAELEHYLGKWAQKRYDDYPILFLATHGDKGELQWSSAIALVCLTLPRFSATRRQVATSTSDRA